MLPQIQDGSAIFSDSGLVRDSQLAGRVLPHNFWATGSNLNSQWVLIITSTLHGTESFHKVSMDSSSLSMKEEHSCLPLPGRLADQRRFSKGDNVKLEICPSPVLTARSPGVPQKSSLITDDSSWEPSIPHQWEHTFPKTGSCYVISINWSR